MSKSNKPCLSCCSLRDDDPGPVDLVMAEKNDNKSQ